MSLKRLSRSETLSSTQLGDLHIGNLGAARELAVSSVFREQQALFRTAVLLDSLYDDGRIRTDVSIGAAAGYIYHYGSSELYCAWANDDDSTPVGAMALHDRDEDTLVLDALVVDVRFQALGIGSAMMRHAEYVAKEREKVHVELTSLDEATGFYDAQGYIMEDVGSRFPVHRRSIT